MPFLTGSSAPVTNGAGVPGTLLQPRVATLGGATFGLVDALGTFVYLNDIKGWAGSSAPTGEVTQRVGAHGGYASPSFLTPRVLEVSLSLVGGSFDLVEQSLGRILGAVPLSDLGTLSVTNPEGLTLSAEVRQAGEVLSDQKGATARVSIPLVAPDPRRYGAAVTASTGLPRTLGGVSVPLSTPITVAQNVISGVLTVTNDGNVSTPPVLTVLGPCPPCSITHLQSGRVLRVPDPIAAGRSLVIDMDSGSALMDGTEQRPVPGTPFEYVPGVNTVAFGAATFDSGALLSSVSRSAWR